MPERTPKAIRAALAPEELDAFDRGYRAVMAQATEELDLAPAIAFVDQWWPLAVQRAIGDHDRLMEDAARIQERAARGEPLGTVPLDEEFATRLRARIDTLG
ncbi:DUF6247 family protein [Spongiactinospora sp. TRM90649]|uniref:DUF6247 family protein n=1 Tax=Spongiactinospora sp. TRM90649 TaxID=3031114 RepID=UPI0023F8151A|nr:DUF6247 family protein [Spongiactinospora sp. TRM90649]MDF5751175.1 DUF6247 family protein [Spongiactinospora sp. TRM90649]